MTARTARLRRPRTLLLTGAVAAALAGAALAPSAMAATTGSSSSSEAPAAPTDGSAPTPPEGGRAGGPGEGGPKGGPGGGPGGESTVTAVDGDSITVTSGSGTETTYAISADTTVSLGGGPGAEDSGGDTSDLEVGQRVHVRADAATDGGEATATAIEVRLPSLRGTVASVSGSGFTLVDRDGFTRTVTLDDGATVTDAGAASSLDSLAEGDVVTAVGEVDADGTTLLASSVRTGDAAPAAPAEGPGEGTAPTAPAEGEAPAGPADGSAPVAPEAEVNAS